MPKLVDYVARFEDIRRAAYEVTLRDGPTALTLAAVAAEMGLSVRSLSRLMHSADALPRLGVQWAEAIMREHMFSVPLREQRSGAHSTRAARALLLMLPSTASLADAERVWRALVGAHEKQASWAHEARRAQLLAQQADCRRLVGALGLPAEGEQYEVMRLRALIEGVTACICARALDPEDGAAVVRRHLEALLGDHTALDAATSDQATSPPEEGGVGAA